MEREEILAKEFIGKRKAQQNSLGFKTNRTMRERGKKRGIGVAE